SRAQRPQATGIRRDDLATLSVIARGARLAAMSQFPRAKTGTGPQQQPVDAPSFAAFRDVPRTGVIYVTTEAQKRGYSPSSADWAASEELLGVLRLFSPIPILLEGERGYTFSATDLRREILGRGLSAMLLSNPANPTGKVIGGKDLAEWVAASRELDCALILD